MLMSLADHHPDHQFPRFDRRTALKAGAAAAVAGALGLGGRAARAAQRPQEPPSAAKPFAPGRAKNVIFMVSDGMSTGTLTLADMLIRRKHNRPSWWVDLWSKPGVKRATARTHSLDSLVTDSAAGGSAWGSGTHINNGCLNVLPDGTQLLPILLHAKQVGKGTGVVTTARVTHATPASFYSNCPRRDYEGMIGAQLLERGIDIALGGGAKFFPESETSKHPEVQIVRTKKDLANALSAAVAMGSPPSARVVGLFDNEHIPYVLDRDDTIPSLPEMTREALSHLDYDSRGFVLQIEGGRVDHAAHNNDAASLVREQIEFDETIGAVLEWAKVGNRAQDTLIILTTDHGNGNPGLTLYGEQGEKAFANLDRATKSFDWIAEQIHGIKPAAARVSRMIEVVKTASGYDLTADDRRLLEESLQDRRAMAFAEANKWTSVLGAILADHYGVAFVSPNHTSDYVEVTALGPGSESIGGCIDNVALHGTMLAALNLPEAKFLPGMETPMQMPKAIKPD
jgi:alkaline phosphatase